MMTDNPPRLMTRPQAAAYLGISASTFSTWVAMGKAPPPVPGTRRWDKKAIDAKFDDIDGIRTGEPEDEFDRWERLNAR
jgi:predicted DNA-binding transcriptional regulator AlpA